MALWMKQNAVIGTRGTTLYSGAAVMKTPTCEPGDPQIADGTEAALYIPEKAKRSSTPKRIRHVISFAFLEVGFIGRIVRVCFAFDLNMPSNGRATRQPQPLGFWAALAVARFPEKAPVVKSLPPKILLLEPALGFFWMPSPGPLPQTREDGGGLLNYYYRKAA